MFLGTTPRILAQYIQQQIEKVQPARVFVPFAGNFVIEQLVGSVSKKIEIHSTDISLYSRAVGYGLASKNSTIRLKESILKQFPYFKGKTAPLEIAAIAIFFSEAGTAIAKAQKVKYYQELLKDAIANHESYYTHILQKLEKVKEIIGKINFYGEDACVFLSMVKGEDDLIYYNSPTIKGGYERMFKAVRYDQLMEAHQKGAVMLCNAYYPENYLTNLPDGYKEIYRWQKTYNKHISIFSNIDATKWVSGFIALREKQKNYPIIDFEDDITENTKIEVVKEKSEIVNHYRLMWVKKADMTGGGINFTIFADKKLIGCAVLNSRQTFGIDFISIFSDPAALTSKYKRLSKLILYIICTQEMINLINDITMWHHTGFTTSVTTNYEVSMKYRSLFKLAKKKNLKEGNYKYNLIYQNKEKILPSYQDGLNEWLKKDGKKLKHG